MCGLSRKAVILAVVMLIAVGAAWLGYVSKRGHEDQTRNLEGAGSSVHESSAGKSARMERFLVPAASVRVVLAGDKPPLLIDLRDPAVFSRCFIPGSANLSKDELSAMAGGLGGQGIVLLGEGFSDRALLEYCVVLEAKGLPDCLVLEGGLRAWRKAGGKLEGPAAGSFLEASISPELFIHHSDPSVTLVSIGNGADVFSSREHRRFKSQAELKTLMGELPGRASNLPVRAVVVASADGSGYEAVERSLGRDSAVPVFYLEGGAAGFEEAQLRVTLPPRWTQTTEAMTATRGPKAAPGSGCASCP